ncbi:VOC family protein [Tuwongella immobilis]|uniref:VOC domain-containing protein n=1 Tax=Tuwongella immobilis TaxID=692036 RepID=A0A6C2YGX4_9BACT|nr:VOC family protein [Tuwongella immobilis]VIP00667.1 Glyoxalase/bleomycin resistance protein/dioxygenase superfamily protein OS=uncultured marine bacterium MedDCM-OCT-S04-C123 PE=4 SV=1: Glyoxalase_2 [Tuwongella immobilis]VTR96752.1 Glyoxalase/bleomycin resistance protein/dioxygenase superfamily protein OS=uncultured marine bacterium MedDCM-OCT-S04-C123 PE=4 SV=1: Glyoxalase_2 [Tuwongella immobilis]
MRIRALVLLGMLAIVPSVSAAEPESPIASTTIDLGMVVSNVEKSVQFYTQAIGFTEAGGFSVNGEFSAKLGLTDKQPLDVRVLVLGKDAKATKLKLMQLPATKPAAGNNTFIHSQLGFRYLTIMVKDVDEALKRLEKLEIKPVTDGAVSLPKELATGVGIIVVRDPDGNFVELVGPKK